MALIWPPKDPNEVLDYALNWPRRLVADTIIDSVYSVVTGSVVIDSSTFTDTQTKVWLSGGTEDETCQLLNVVTTAGGRTMEATVKLKIKSR